MALLVGGALHMPSGVHTEVLGNRKVTVDGCDGVVDYGDEQVILRAGRMRILVTGHSLHLKVLTDSAAVIEGYLTAVNFAYG